MEQTKIFIDFETQSNDDIRLGVNHYLSCKDFRAYLLSYSIDGKNIKTVESKLDGLVSITQLPKSLVKIIKSGNYLVIAHNIIFDVSVWNKIFTELKIDFKKTLDTSWLCRVLNVPASLDKATKFFGITEKDIEGKKVNSKYYKPVEIPSNDLERLIEYNRQDVQALISLYETLEKVEIDKGNQFIYDSVNKQNEIIIDFKKFESLLKLKKEIPERTEKKALQLFPTYKKSGQKELVSIAYSANEIKKYLASNGVKLPSISKNKIEEELNLQGVKLDDKSKMLIDLYRVLQAKGLSKYDTFSEFLSFSTSLKDFQISHGTHTGRPAGRGLQLHNISRPSKDIENLSSLEVIKKIESDLKKENFLEASKNLSSLIWACMIPDSKKEIVARYDLSAIEPRVGAFLRDDKKLLDLYRLADEGKGKDEYTIFGEKMGFPKDILRQISKVIILAACYGMGANALRASIINVGLPDIGENEARKLISSYHALNPSVKKSWYAIESKMKLAIINGHSEYNSLEFERVIIKDKKFIAISLPSGRKKYYADCSITSQGKILYNDSRMGKIELRPYLLYENLVQASATDVLFLKSAKVEKLNCKIKLTIYDELIVSTLPKNVKAIRQIMKEEEEAYSGMPLSFKGCESSTFWKGDKA